MLDMREIEHRRNVARAAYMARGSRAALDDLLKAIVDYQICSSQMLKRMIADEERRPEDAVNIGASANSRKENLTIFVDRECGADSARGGCAKDTN